MGRIHSIVLLLLFNLIVTRTAFPQTGLPPAGIQPDSPENITEEKILDSGAVETLLPTLSEKSGIDPFLVGSSVAIVYAFLEYRNAEEASDQLEDEKNSRDSASTYSEARYHQAKAELYSEQIDDHYQKCIIGTAVAAGLFAWKIWTAESGLELPFFSVYRSRTNHLSFNLSLAYDF